MLKNSQKNDLHIDCELQPAEIRFSVSCVPKLVFNKPAILAVVLNFNTIHSSYYGTCVLRPSNLQQVWLPSSFYSEINLSLTTCHLRPESLEPRGDRKTGSLKLILDAMMFYTY